MDALFLKILNMSISASWLILAVVLLRLLLKKAPKWINCVLWALVAVRLLCPISFESSLSLVPNAEPVPKEIFVVEPPESHGNTVIDPVINPNLPETPPAVLDTSIDMMQTKHVFATLIWMGGAAVMLAYAAISYLRLRYKVRASLHLRDGIWICDDIQSPFILGFFRPRIYLPSGTDGGQMAHIVAHENAHLKRRDHWWKPLGFLVLAIHWFNPLVWVAYVLLCRDIELACDEKVIRDLNREESISYSEALLACSVSRRTILVCPLTFGEVGVKERVKQVLNYKKPAFWIIIAAVIACIVLAVCFLTNPHLLEITVSGSKYDYVGVSDLPIGSIEVGELSRDGEYTGKHFDENYHGVPIYQNDDKSVLYLATSDGFLKFQCTEHTPSLVEWFDYIANPDEMIWDGRMETTIGSFPGVTFRWYSEKIEAVTENGTTTLLTGMPIWNCFFSDLNGDGNPEICVTTSFGSGMIDERVLVYDFAAWTSYELSDRGKYDYVLSKENGVLVVSQYDYPRGENSVPTKIGTLVMKDGNLIIANDVPDIIQKQEFDEVVSTTILNHFAPSNPDGLIHVESHKTLLTNQSGRSDEDISGATVYLLVLHETFKPDSDFTKPLESVGGSYIPTVLTFRVNEMNGYVLEEYWEPRDGGYYTDDINNKFPEEALQQVRNDQDYVEALEAENEQKAFQILMLQGDFAELVDGLLTTICSEPSTSSNPGDYIRENQVEYDTLLRYGEATLKFCFREFLAGGQTDLRGHIMASLCRDIIYSWGEAVLMTDSVGLTGQDRFDAFYSNAQELERQYSQQDLEKHYPASWLLLQMIDTEYPIVDDPDATVSKISGPGIVVAVTTEETILYNDNQLTEGQIIIPTGKAVAVQHTDLDNDSSQIVYGNYTGWVETSLLKIGG